MENVQKVTVRNNEKVLKIASKSYSINWFFSIENIILYLYSSVYLIIKMYVL